MTATISAALDGEMEQVRELFQEYAASIGIDLGYQGFASELARLPGSYAPPNGALFLARNGSRPVGCGAFRRFDESTCEMKRLYVQSAEQGQGLGRKLAERLIAKASQAGYSRMLLDTLPTMTGALRLYESLGFTRCTAYYACPVAGNVFMALDLAKGSGKGSSAGPAIP